MASESKRQQRFSSVIQQDLADIFLREAGAWLPGVMITVTRVRVTSDLGIVRAYLSFLNAKAPNDSLELIRSKASEIRYRLGSRIKNQTKSIPTLEFYLDDNSDYVEHIDKLFNEINKENPGND